MKITGIIKQTIIGSYELKLSLSSAICDAHKEA